MFIWHRAVADDVTAAIEHLRGTIQQSLGCEVTVVRPGTRDDEVLARLTAMEQALARIEGRFSPPSAAAPPPSTGDDFDDDGRALYELARNLGRSSQDWTAAQRQELHAALVVAGERAVRPVLSAVAECGRYEVLDEATAVLRDVFAGRP